MKIKLALSLGFIIPALAMQPSLKDFDYNAASVLPYTRWKPKGQGQAYFLLAREAYGSDKGTYDAFGGKRDPNENHPVITASREFVEESAEGLFTSNKLAKNHIDTSAKNTHAIVAHKRKKVVYYITKFASVDADKLVRDFYKNIAQPHRPIHQKEKDRLAWVSWHNLEKAISGAYTNCIDIRGLGIPVLADVIYPDGTKKSEYIPLRSILVSALQPFFTKKSCEVGKDPRIKFYN